MDDIEPIARAAVLAGGAELRRRFDADDAAATYGEYDVKAAADRAAEDQMVPVVRRAFPDHAVYAEERGELAGDAPYRWIIDPLDGTNNFAAGLPTFATSVAVLQARDPELAVVYLPVSAELSIARAGDGVTYQGEAVQVSRHMAVSETTVATIGGRTVPQRPELADRMAGISAAAADTVKRVIPSWAPTVHTALFARGRIQGLIEFHPDIEETAVTALFAAEAGAAIRHDGPLTVAASDDELLERLWTAATETV